MSNKIACELIIDSSFKALIPPLSNQGRQHLELNILNEGCREPICIWKNIILDGHNRYEICSKHNIPFNTVDIKIKKRDEAIAWICVNQLGKRNINEATRKYLIGRRYEAEKNIGTKNVRGSNQYSMRETPESYRIKTAERIGNDYQISHATVAKYSIYANALDVLNRNQAELVSKILSGQVKISHENVIELSKLPEDEVSKISQQVITDEADYIGYVGVRKEILQKVPDPPTKIPLPTGDIKNTPKYDPDAEISSLTLTIPSWVSSINRTCSISNFVAISFEARERLEKQLNDLQITISDMLTAIKEKNDG